MPRKSSAGVLLFRWREAVLEVLLVHPGGPFWQRKDDGAWTLPKGEIDLDEIPEVAARREFEEETGTALTAPLIALNPVRQPGGKVVHAFAAEGDLDAAAVRSNTFSMEWPPRSGRTREFPEVDRAGWFDLATATRKLIAGQRPILDQLAAALLAARR